MRKRFEQQAKHIKVKVNFIGKFMCALLTIWSYATFIIFLGFFANFSRDFPFVLKINMHENGFFEICETLKVECQPYSLNTILLKTFFNIFLIITFWAQQIIMAKLSFKLFAVKLFPEYLIIERPMYNLASQLVFILTFSLWQPIDLVLFNFIEQSLIVDIIGSLGFLLLTKSVYDSNSDLMGWQFMKKVFKSKEISFNAKYLPQDSPDLFQLPKIYKMCRHPIQLAKVIIILTGGKIWSVSRIIYSLGIIVERRFGNLYDSYREYKEKVQFRLIPNIFALFGSENTEQNEIEDTQIDENENSKNK